MSHVIPSATQQLHHFRHRIAKDRRAVRELAERYIVFRERRDCVDGFPNRRLDPLREQVFVETCSITDRRGRSVIGAQLPVLQTPRSGKCCPTSAIG
jgi:hypothetical protein